VYADVDGHIGYQAPGVIPVRRLGEGRWPVPGWDARYGWSGAIPFRQLPWALDPPDGLVVTANQAVVDPDGYPYPLGADTAYGYRSQRIHDLLAAGADWDPDALLRLQTDTLHPLAGRLVPLLLRQPLPTAYLREGQQLLEGWDGMQPPGSGAAAYFNVVWSNLLSLTFHDQLPEDVWPDGGERWFAAVQALLREPDSPWWDDVHTENAVEAREDILVAAMEKARDDLTSMQAEDPDKWSWGGLHELRLQNQTLGQSGLGPVEALFNRGPYQLGGGTGSVLATAWEASEGFDVTAVPSMRMVVPLDDLDASRWVVLGGASGHAFSSHYNDQTEVWAAGETVEWPFSEPAVQSAAEDVLRLVPAGSDQP
jgi:penicillin amidase